MAKMHAQWKEVGKEEKEGERRGWRDYTTGSERKLKRKKGVAALLWATHQAYEHRTCTSVECLLLRAESGLKSQIGAERAYADCNKNYITP